MTREEAIKKANDKLGGLTYLSECAANPGLRKVYGNMADWLSKVIYLAEIGLKTQQEQERNEPLTLDELRDVAETGDPVWLVGMEDGDGWRRIDYVELLTIGYSCFGDSESWCFRTTGYGVRVFAYRRKPKGEQNEGKRL